MAIRQKPAQWTHFPSKSEWDETDSTERIRRSAELLIDSLDRHEAPVTDRTRIALKTLRRAIREEHAVD